MLFSAFDDFMFDATLVCQPITTGGGGGCPRPVLLRNKVHKTKPSNWCCGMESARQRLTGPAATKLYAYWVVLNYREAYGIHASNGIQPREPDPNQSSQSSRSPKIAS